MIIAAIIVIVFIAVTSWWETRVNSPATYNNVRFTALRDEELLHIIHNEVTEDPKHVLEAKHELDKRRVKY